VDRHHSRWWKPLLQGSSRQTICLGKLRRTLGSPPCQSYMAAGWAVTTSAFSGHDAFSSFQAASSLKRSSTLLSKSVRSSASRSYLRREKGLRRLTTGYRRIARCLQGIIALRSYFCRWPRPFETSMRANSNPATAGLRAAQYCDMSSNHQHYSIAIKRPQ